MTQSIIVDPTETPNSDPSDVNQLKLDLTQAVAEPTPAEPVTEPTPAPQEELPDKFRGKSTSEVVEMYQNLEQEYGRKANELGQQRILVDQLNQKRMTDLTTNTPDNQPAPQPELPDVSPSDLLDNPTEAIKRIAEAAQAPALSRVEQLEGQLAQQRFVNNHPDYADQTADPLYSTWVAAAADRQSLAARAVQSQDYAAADSLLNEFKLFKSAIAQQVTPSSPGTPAQPASDVTQAILESAHNSQGDVTPPPGKAYSRLALQRLRMTDPETYNDPAFQQEIVRAYAENRVK